MPDIVKIVYNLQPSHRHLLSPLKQLEAGIAAPLGEADPHPTVEAVPLASGAIHHVSAPSWALLCPYLLLAFCCALLLIHRPLLLPADSQWYLRHHMDARDHSLT